MNVLILLMKFPVVWRFLKTAVVTSDFGFDIDFGLFRRSEVRISLFSSGREY